MYKAVAASCCWTRAGRVSSFTSLSNFWADQSLGQSHFVRGVCRDFEGLNVGKLAENSERYRLVDVRAQRSRFFKKYKGTSQETVQMVVNVLCKSGDSAEVTLNKHGRWLKPPDWFSIMDGLGKRRRWQLALEVFRWIQSQKWYKPDNGYYSKLISIMGKERQYRLAMWLFAEMKKMGCRPDSSLYNSVIGVHLSSDDKGKGLEKAVGVLEEMKLKRSCQPNVVTYNILIRAVAQLGYEEKVNEFFRDMLNQDLVPDLYTYNGLIDAYGKAGKILEMEKAFKRMTEDRLKPDLVTFNTLIDSYGKAGEFWKMEVVLASMSGSRKGGKLQPSVKTFNSMITNYGNAGMWEKSEWIFQEMQKAEVQPSTITYQALLSAYGTSGLFSRMKEVVKNMMTWGPRPEACTLNQMIDSYCRHDMTDEAEALLRSSMEEVGVFPTSLSHGIIIRHHKNVGKLSRIQPLLDQMKSWGLKPTKQIYMDVLDSIALGLDYKVEEQSGNKLSLFDSGLEDEQIFNAALEGESDVGSQYTGVCCDPTSFVSIASLAASSSPSEPDFFPSFDSPKHVNGHVNVGKKDERDTSSEEAASAPAPVEAPSPITRKPQVLGARKVTGGKHGGGLGVRKLTTKSSESSYEQKPVESPPEPVVTSASNSVAQSAPGASRSVYNDGSSSRAKVQGSTAISSDDLFDRDEGGGSPSPSI